MNRIVYGLFIFLMSIPGWAQNVNVKREQTQTEWLFLNVLGKKGVITFLGLMIFFFRLQKQYQNIFMG